MEKVVIGAVQMASKLADKEGNIKQALTYIAEYGDRADILIFPELFTTGYDLDIVGDDYYSLAEKIPGRTTEIFSEYARMYKTAIIGNMVERDKNVGEILYNTTFVIDKKGDYTGKYRKVHVYPAEFTYFKRGTEFPVFNVNGVKIGLATCYDHGFGEMFRILARKGAQIIFIPSAIPKGYEYLLKLRTRARAQDNQLFTVAVNSAGKTPNSHFCGNSMVVNPRGEIIQEADDGEGVFLAELDLELIERERKQEPLIRDSAFDLYMKEYKRFLE
ncbi:carbon-nitrogen hydrolase family protein [Halothermothrix orenii]|uniref:Nitrilase/cyanide hydratase n=1 Tax=Halothermothrix orenii (strain H 168 / OCM 544 / DSM 9562) TaxID=373903 RepID=B8D189_HALOH|nr:carbon-nitrogen hydrolase family protein [Halothermothrix orenii]ACL71041.1 Nitrilase/cyanide hydratase [Halothermothrix orenii H 168]